MKILAFADSHAEPGSEKALIETLAREAVDLVLCAGDFTQFGERGDVVLEALGQTGTPSCFVSGNHELGRLDQILAPYRHAINVTMRCLQLNGLYVAGLPYSQYGDVQIDEHCRACLDAIAPDGTSPALDILLSHEPPKDTCLAPGGAGSTVVRRMIERLRPRLAVCGHIHMPVTETRLGRTRVVNPGPTGYVLEMDQPTL